jgi:hypothetical protein
MVENRAVDDGTSGAMKDLMYRDKTGERICPCMVPRRIGL